MSTNTQRNYARKLARKKALQALYQWDLAGHDVAEILRQFEAFQDMKKVDVNYFQELLRGVTKQVDSLDETISQYAGRNTDELDPIECNVLRLCTYELASRIDIPYRVTINEAIELTKLFGSEQGHKFVNGVIDKIARQLRPHEIHAN